LATISTSRSSMFNSRINRSVETWTSGHVLATRRRAASIQQLTCLSLSQPTLLDEPARPLQTIPSSLVNPRSSNSFPLFSIMVSGNAKTIRRSKTRTQGQPTPRTQWPTKGDKECAHRILLTERISPRHNGDFPITDYTAKSTDSVK